EPAHRRGHVAVDVAAIARPERRELCGQVLDALAGDARHRVLSGELRPVALQAVHLAGKPGPSGAGRGAPLPDGGPWRQAAVIEGEVAEIVVAELFGDRLHHRRGPV